MDVLALAMAKKYTDSQRLGYEEKKIQTYTITEPGVDLLGDGKSYTKVSDNPIDLATVSKYTAYGNSEAIEITSFGNVQNGSMSALMAEGNIPLVVSAVDSSMIPQGFYVWSGYSYDNTFFEKVVLEFTTLKTIDPKFLPNPNFEMWFDAMGLMGGTNLYLYKTNEVEDSTQRVTEEELRKALNDGKQIIVKMVQPSAPPDMIAVFTPISVSVANGMGVADIFLSGGGTATLYTAEYTP